MKTNAYLIFNSVILLVCLLSGCAAGNDGASGALSPAATAETSAETVSPAASAEVSALPMESESPNALEIQDSIQQVLSDKEHYPHIMSISASEDYSKFNVVFSGTEINVYETTLRLSLYLVGDKYRLCQGTPDAECLTVVDYIDNSTGAVFASGDSSALH